MKLNTSSDFKEKLLQFFSTDITSYKGPYKLYDIIYNMDHSISYYLEKWFSINGRPRILNKLSIEFDWVEFPNSHKTFFSPNQLIYFEWALILSRFWIHVHSRSTTKMMFHHFRILLNSKNLWLSSTSVLNI